MTHYLVNTRIYTTAYIIDAPDEDTAVKAYEKLIKMGRANLVAEDSEIDCEDTAIYNNTDKPDFIANEVLEVKK